MVYQRIIPGLSIYADAEKHGSTNLCTFALQIKKELSLLQKLYGLYNDVIDQVYGYYDILWIEVDIDKINNEIQEFQNRCGAETNLKKMYETHTLLRIALSIFGSE